MRRVGGAILKVSLAGPQPRPLHPSPRRPPLPFPLRPASRVAPSAGLSFGAGVGRLEQLFSGPAGRFVHRRTRNDALTDGHTNAHTPVLRPGDGARESEGEKEVPRRFGPAAAPTPPSLPPRSSRARLPKTPGSFDRCRRSDRCHRRRSRYLLGSGEGERAGGRTS